MEDEWNVWSLVRTSFESRLPLRKAVLHNKLGKAVEVERLPLDYVLSTDARLRTRPPPKNSPHWFRHPYATIILTACDVSKRGYFASASTIAERLTVDN